jgi:hypothetical protein
MTVNVYPSSIPDLEINLDSPEWFEWLEAQMQFKYCGNLTEMSVKRRPNGKWYARKKIRSSNGSKPVDLYIGSDEECTSEALKEINYQFSQDWVSFWNWYYDPARKGDKPKGVQPNPMYTLAEATLESGEDIGKLQARIAELEKLVKHYSTDRDTLANLMAERDNRHSYNMQEALTKVEQTEQQVSKLKSAIAKLKRDVKAERDRADEYCLDGLKAATILHEALKLKANSGGAIKTKIKEALKLIDDI